MAVHTLDTMLQGSMTQCIKSFCLLTLSPSPFALQANAVKKDDRSHQNASAVVLAEPADLTCSVALRSGQCTHHKGVEGRCLGLAVRQVHWTID